jgi:hypothetical protein
MKENKEVASLGLQRMARYLKSCNTLAGRGVCWGLGGLKESVQRMDGHGSAGQKGPSNSMALGNEEQEEKGGMLLSLT